MVTVKILGKGCPRCNRLEHTAQEAADAAGVDATFVHVKEMDKIMAYGVAMTPALVINEEVKSAGDIPSQDQIAAWLKAAAS